MNFDNDLSKHVQISIELITVTGLVIQGSADILCVRPYKILECALRARHPVCMITDLVVIILN